MLGLGLLVRLGRQVLAGPVADSGVLPARYYRHLALAALEEEDFPGALRHLKWAADPLLAQILVSASGSWPPGTGASRRPSKTSWLRRCVGASGALRDPAGRRNVGPGTPPGLRGQGAGPGGGRAEEIRRIILFFPEFR